MQRNLTYEKKGTVPVPKPEKFKTIITNPRLLATILLAFSSGLPLTLTGSTLQAWFTVSGIAITTIGALSLIGQPYVYKFLWAPLLDRYYPRFLGHRRGWIFIFQGCLAFSLTAMAFCNPRVNPALLGGLALLTAFFSASQDVAIDAYRTDLLKPEERGLGATITVFGYRIALLVSGGLALVLADEIGWRNTYLLMAGLMVIEMIILCRLPEPAKPAHPPKTLLSSVVEPFKQFWSQEYGWLLLLFILVYKLSDVIALSLSTVFLIRGLGFSLTAVGLLYKSVGLAASLIGSLAGGIAVSMIGLYRCLFFFGILQGVSNLLFAILAIMGKSYGLMVGAIFVESFCGSLSSVAMVAFLMSLCDPRYTATQYALLTAFGAIPLVFIGPFAAWMVQQLGWVDFFISSVFFMLPGLGILLILRKRIYAVSAT